jgi:hypothetical protein
MAGAYTHLLVCDIGKTRRGVLGKELWQLLNRHYRFLFLGSVSPDLPYLSFETGSVNWADAMHYEKTNSTFETAYTALKPSWTDKTEADQAKLVWLLGYVSHMVADATIHPVVQATVGIYEDHKAEHRDCEMTQDSIIFNAKKDGADIRYAEFADMVRFCKASPHFDKLMSFWKDLIMTNYVDKHEEVHPELWFTMYSAAIDVADANSVFTALFRHVGIGSYLYKTAEDIKTNHSNEYMKYFQAVTLPDKTTTNFNNVFTRTLNNVTDAWKAIYDGLTPGSPPVTIVKAWNLDTGVDKNSSNQEVTYWT